ncbi:TPA: superantigen-like protein SSL1 [Staphylococcus aureus]|uniref:Exotoxin n=9 Tax=Staphylococcus aureus TaxID=1280 RepID=A0A2S6DG14_STAAU|nr:superantigen-like protein SSL1 [Staphylococcus aureus]HDH6210785.1 superantigen-like protein SSL1 [Staphylococcus aureus LTCF-12-55]HDH6225340.1 superantigen-like protein SSL1 [Staphylococcus aureus LTCF-12-46]HDH6264440.1 superantigen-like protein SSL1 [Staphylococcus aureus LTCF-7-30]HDH6421696.1 superantigen-like protein SSL1 [Staphylococcus aureus MRSA-Lux-33]HDH6424015.1 superantigen-like protein SSL1 [Staphylococcus aureus MRSA-Lux-34]HDH6426998.1 superantigen-like protein SSL1 [Stap
MKFKAIAKASLALGMLATGVITSNIQSVQAKTEVKQQSESELKHYYNKPVLERKNVTGYKYTEKGKDYIDVIVDNQYSQISLVGSDKDKFKDGDNSNIDVFILREGDSRQATNYSIGGVTKSNSVQYIDYINTPILEIKKGNEDVLKDLYYISKEDISLKELDYRLRERAIKQHGLYSNGLKQGQITITMKDGKSHTIDLSQKLEKERMGDSIDGTKIDRILVEIK